MEEVKTQCERCHDDKDETTHSGLDRRKVIRR